MERPLTQERYDKIKKAVEKALSARNQKEAQPYISELSGEMFLTPPPANNILADLISSVKAASGRVADKERKKSFCMMDLNKLQGCIKTEE